MHILHQLQRFALYFIFSSFSCLITYSSNSQFVTCIFAAEKINIELNTKSYLARPYCSNDEGSVENKILNYMIPKQKLQYFSVAVTS